MSGRAGEGQSEAQKQEQPDGALVIPRRPPAQPPEVSGLRSFGVGEAALQAMLTRRRRRAAWGRSPLIAPCVLCIMSGESG